MMVLMLGYLQLEPRCACIVQYVFEINLVCVGLWVYRYTEASVYHVHCIDRKCYADQLATSTGKPGPRSNSLTLDLLSQADCVALCVVLLSNSQRSSS